VPCACVPRSALFCPAVHRRGRAALARSALPRGGPKRRDGDLRKELRESERLRLLRRPASSPLERRSLLGPRTGGALAAPRAPRAPRFSRVPPPQRRAPLPLCARRRKRPRPPGPPAPRRRRHPRPPWRRAGLARRVDLRPRSKALSPLPPSPTLKGFEPSAPRSMPSATARPAGGAAAAAAAPLAGRLSHYLDLLLAPTRLLRRQRGRRALLSRRPPRWLRGVGSTGLARAGRRRVFGRRSRAADKSGPPRETQTTV